MLRAGGASQVQILDPGPQELSRLRAGSVTTSATRSKTTSGDTGPTAGPLAPGRGHAGSSCYHFSFCFYWDVFQVAN